MDGFILVSQDLQTLDDADVAQPALELPAPTNYASCGASTCEVGTSNRGGASLPAPASNLAVGCWILGRSVEMVLRCPILKTKHK